MTVNPNTTVNELMCQFAEHFPFLRLALYEGVGSKKRAATENDFALKNGTTSVEVIFESNTKVRDFVEVISTSSRIKFKLVVYDSVRKEEREFPLFFYFSEYVAFP